jgi:hypothetical protein
VARRSAALLGASAFVLLGILGLVSGTKLFGLFQVSVLLNLLHLALGAVAVASTRAAATASLALWLLGVVGGGGWIPVNRADNWLHVGLGLVLLAVARVAA